jgi:polysaccharide biosynthesis protein PslH
MRILFITDYLPYPPISGDRIRVYNLLRRIAQQHDVWLATPIIEPDEADGLSHLQEFCQGIAMAELKRHKFARLPGMIRYALTSKPYELEFLYSHELASQLRQLESTTHFDVVHIEQSRMALYLEVFPPKACFKSVLGFQNIAAIQYSRIAQVAKSSLRKMRPALYGWTMKNWEPRYAERFDYCTTVSEEDRDWLISANPRLQIRVIPNGVDTHLYQPLPFVQTESSLLLVGNMDYAPCADGAIWFCNEILPRIRQRVAGVQVWIVGRKPTPAVIKLDGNDVHVTGKVEDILPYYQQSSVCIVPLRAGGGSRLKIPEAMALGRPIVSTTIGCEGHTVVDGEHLLIGDSPEQFAENTVRLLTNKTLYQNIAFNARRLVVEKYGWDALAGQLIDLYSELTNQHEQHVKEHQN